MAATGHSKPGSNTSNHEEGVGGDSLVRYCTNSPLPAVLEVRAIAFEFLEALISLCIHPASHVRVHSLPMVKLNVLRTASLRAFRSLSPVVTECLPRFVPLAGFELALRPPLPCLARYAAAG